MPEYYLRHTVYTKVEAPHVQAALIISADVREQLIEQLQANNVQTIDYDEQKAWELVAQHRFQKES